MIRVAHDFKLWTVIVLMLASAVAVAAPELAVVSAETSGDVVWVDVAGHQTGHGAGQGAKNEPAEIARITVGARPRGLALATDQKWLFVALAGAPSNGASGGLAIVDVSSRKVTRTLSTGSPAYSVAVAADGRTAFVSLNAANEVAVVDLASGKIKTRVPVGTEPRGLAIRPDGKVVYVTATAVDEVYAIDARKLSLIMRSNAGSRPQLPIFDRSGAIALVPGESFSSVALLDAKLHTIKEVMSFEGKLKSAAKPAFQSAALSPDGRRLYLTGGPGKSVVAVDVGKKTAVATVEDVGAFPRGIATAGDGRWLYVANGPSNDLAVVDIAKGKVTQRIGVQGGPWDVVLLRSARRGPNP